MKRFISLLTAVLLSVAILPGSVFCADCGTANSTTDVEAPTFTDVSPEDWFHDSVETVSKAGLMIGRGDGVFDPDGLITRAEAVTIAARVHSILTNGSPDAADHYLENLQKEQKVPENAVPEPWYRTYILYAEEYLGEFFVMPATLVIRRYYANLLATAVGDQAAEINEIKENAIPDLKENALTAGIYRLYRAGILTGNDGKGSFLPDAWIRRCEAAAIAARILDPSLRRTFSLTEQYRHFETTYTAPDGWFTLTLPDWWEDEVLMQPGFGSGEDEDVFTLSFICGAERKLHEGNGFLGIIGVRPREISRVGKWPTPATEIAEVTYPDGKTYDITLHFPSDVQYTPGTQEDYNRQFRSVSAVAAAMQFPEGCEVTWRTAYCMKPKITESVSDGLFKREIDLYEFEGDSHCKEEINKALKAGFDEREKYLNGFRDYEHPTPEWGDNWVLHIDTEWVEYNGILFITEYLLHPSTYIPVPRFESVALDLKKDLLLTQSEILSALGVDPDELRTEAFPVFRDTMIPTDRDSSVDHFVFRDIVVRYGRLCGWFEYENDGHVTGWLYELSQDR